MSERYVLYSALYEEGRIRATYANQVYVGEGYESEPVYETKEDIMGNPDDTVAVNFYPRRVLVKNLESGRTYEGSGNYDKDALDRAAEGAGPLEVEDLEEFDQEFAGERSMESFVESQAGGMLEFVEDNDVRLHYSTVVNGKQIEVTFVPNSY